MDASHLKCNREHEAQNAQLQDFKAKVVVKNISFTQVDVRLTQHEIVRSAALVWSSWELYANRFEETVVNISLVRILVRSIVMLH